MKKYLLALFLLFSFCSAKVDFEIYSSNAILIDAKTGNILFEKNAYDKAYPASTTKILTAFIAINSNINWNQKIIPSHEAIYSVPPGSSVAYFSEGEELNFEQLLYGLMLPSGNDAANILAEHISGSVEEFTKLMNKTATELGAKNSNFVNANGLHDDNHYSTAYDLSLIAQEAMKNQKFRKVVSTYHYIMPKTNRSETEREFFNTNKLLNPNSEFYYKNAIGIKTGFTSNAKNCLVASAEKDNISLISVVLGGSLTPLYNSAIYTDTTNLLNYGFDLFKTQKILDKNTKIESINLKFAKNKKKLDVVNESELLAAVQKDTNPEFEKAISYNSNLAVPIKKGDLVGTISYYLNDVCVCTSNLIANNNVEKENVIIYYIRLISKFLLYTFLSIIVIGVILRIFNEFRKSIKRRKKIKK